MESCLAFAEEHVIWSQDRRYLILWSDETWVNGTKYRKSWVTREAGEELDDTYLPCY